MSNRNGRRVALRALRALRQKARAPSDVKLALMEYLVTEMARRGASILADLERAVGGPPRSGHAVDQLMNAAADMEKAVLRSDPDCYMRAAVEVLFLARDIAIRERKIVVGPVAEA